MGEPAPVSCPHGHACGACGLLEVPYAAQLRDKRDLLAKALGAYPRLRRAFVLPTMPSPRVAGYRNRVKMALRPGRPIRMGYFKLQSRDLVDAPECQVIEPALRVTLDALRGVLSRHPLPQIRFVDLRCGSDPERQHLTLVVGATTLPRLPLEELARACPRVRGISANLNPGSGPQVLKGPLLHLWGERGVLVELPDVRLRVSPSSFFQVNLHLLAAIHARLREFFRGCRSLLDLYAGVGTHGLALASSFQRVLCMEGQPAAVRDAREALMELALPQIAIVGSPVEKSLGRIRTAHPDAVLLNPSRQGATREVLWSITEGGAARVAYLSCEPETLVRDLDLLAQGGLSVVSVEPIDMMPQTRQVEALALLKRGLTRAEAPSVPPSGSVRRRGPKESGRTRTRSAPDRQEDSGDASSSGQGASKGSGGEPSGKSEAPWWPGPRPRRPSR